MFKRIVITLVVRVIKILPDNIAVDFIKYLASVKEWLVINVISEMSRDEVKKKAHGYAMHCQIMRDEEVSIYEYKNLDSARYETICFPCVYGMSNGGEISLYKPDIVLYRFKNSIFHPLSDIIRVGDKAYWDKSYYPQFKQTIPIDIDLIAYNYKYDYVLIKKYDEYKKIKIGFSLAGVHVNSWGHFIGKFLPKIIALDSIKDNGVVVILPNHVDSHIKIFVKACLSSYNNIELEIVDSNVPVLCDILYYCSSPSYIADHATYIHPSSIHISRFAIEAIYRLSKMVSSGEKKRQTKKVFIARDTQRNVTNYDEIMQYFRGLGFQVVCPHLMSFNDKIELFAGVTHICGPGSSGILNIIFCHNKVKVLELSNMPRTIDLYRSAFQVEPFCHSFYLVTGEDEMPYGIHSSYSIPLEKIKRFISESDYLSAL